MAIHPQKTPPKSTALLSSFKYDQWQIYSFHFNSRQNGNSIVLWSGAHSIAMSSIDTRCIWMWDMWTKVWGILLFSLFLLYFMWNCRRCLDLYCMWRILFIVHGFWWVSLQVFRFQMIRGWFNRFMGVTKLKGGLIIRVDIEKAGIGGDW